MSFFKKVAKNSGSTSSSPPSIKNYVGEIRAQILPPPRPQQVEEQVGGRDGNASRFRQTKLQRVDGNTPNASTSFVYNRDKMIDELAKLVIANDLPFNYGESKSLEHFIKTALQPQYEIVPRKVLIRRIVQQYCEARGQLIEMFSNIDCQISLTIDKWTSCCKESFMCVTAHWIDEDWVMQKRIIAFEIIPKKHIGLNMKTRLIKCCKKFHLLDKVYSLSVDNATTNNNVVEHLIDEPAFKKTLNGKLFHVRYGSHVLNLSIQEGILEFSPLLDPVRDIILWFRYETSRAVNVERRYKVLCEQHGLPKKLWYLNSPTNWKSTYKLMSSALKYREILSTLYNENASNDSEKITDDHWTLVGSICDVLQAYDSASKTFSDMYKANINLVILNCVNIVHVINKHVIVPELIGNLEKMKGKWVEFFRTIPHIYGLATILDPTIRLEGLRNLLNHCCEALDMSDYNVDDYVDSCRKLLGDICEFYVSTYNLKIGPPPSELFLLKRFDPIIVDVVIGKGHKGPSSSTTSTIPEVDEYLCVEFEFGPDYDILKWWNRKQDGYPILARIAKDVLAIPASTFVSESAFVAGRNVLDERKCQLSHKIIQISVCKKDWDQVERRTQGRIIGDDEDDDSMDTYSSEDES